MKVTYRVLALLITALVLVQAAAHAWFSAGAGKFVSEGGVLDMSGGSDLQFPEVVGVIVHGMNGLYVIPLVAILFVIVGYFTHTKYGLALAGLTAVLVAIQVTLGLMASGMTILALFHGGNALLLFASALIAERYMSTQMSRAKMIDHPENLAPRPAAMI